MEKAIIVYQPEVEQYINDLVYILFYEDYFTYIENAIDYKDKIINFVEQNILLFPFKKTPKQLAHLGSKYIFYTSNQRTTWYIFFESKDNNYLITYVTNNHVELAKWL